MSYDPDRHQRRSIRLKRFDYSQPRAYFITACVRGRECIFGRVEDGEICLNVYGETVQEVWQKLPNHYVGLRIDAFVVMPNHVHGILVLEAHNIAGAVVGAGLRPAPTSPITDIIRAFKSFSARQINELRGTSGIPVWQRNYYERVIRDEEELQAIREYIFLNPLAWDEDSENPTGDASSRPGS